MRRTILVLVLAVTAALACFGVASADIPPYRPPAAASSSSGVENVLAIGLPVLGLLAVAGVAVLRRRRHNRRSSPGTAPESDGQDR